MNIIQTNPLGTACREGDVQHIRSWLQVNGIPLGLPEMVARLTPPKAQLEIFQMLIKFGWHPNNPGHYGAVVLPLVVTNGPLVQWLLKQKANPNLAQQQFDQDIWGRPDDDFCVALNNAARLCEPSTVQLLLDHGAKVEKSLALHFAAGACPRGQDSYSETVEQLEKFEDDRINVMELLLHTINIMHEKDPFNTMDSKDAINAMDQEIRPTPNFTPGPPIVYAVMAGSVKRTQWLLDRGADPTKEGQLGCAETMGLSLLSHPRMREIFKRWREKGGGRISLGNAQPPSRAPQAAAIFTSSAATANSNSGEKKKKKARSPPTTPSTASQSNGSAPPKNLFEREF